MSWQEKRRKDNQSSEENNQINDGWIPFSCLVAGCKKNLEYIAVAPLFTLSVLVLVSLRPPSWNTKSA